jgi:hypothetical protein
MRVGESVADDKNGSGGGSALPFMVALGAAVLVIAGVFAFQFLGHGNSGLSDSAQIQRTAGQYYGALNKGRYQDLVANTCAAKRAASDFPKSAGFEDAQRRAVEADGERNIAAGSDFKDLKVDGDTATARITLTYDKGEPKRTETVDAKFVREDGKWKMCS